MWQCIANDHVLQFIKCCCLMVQTITILDIAVQAYQRHCHAEENFEECSEEVSLIPFLYSSSTKCCQHAIFGGNSVQQSFNICFIVISHCLLQFDFPFVQTFRVSRFRFRATSAFDELAVGGGDDLGESSSEVRISTERQLQDLSSTTSVWNCDGEIIDEPFIDFR